jgi:hypothetical protein
MVLARLGFQAVISAFALYVSSFLLVCALECAVAITREECGGKPTTL